MEGPYGLGSYGARSLGALNQMFLVLSVATGWKSMGLRFRFEREFEWFEGNLMGLSWENRVCHIFDRDDKMAVMFGFMDKAY